MVSNVIELGPHDKMSPKDVLGLTARESPVALMVLFLGQDGYYYQRSSVMEKDEALMMIDMLRETIDV